MTRTSIGHVIVCWRREDLWQTLKPRLRALVRMAAGRAAVLRPGLDSQSVSSSAHSGPVGREVAKRIKGRKIDLPVARPG